jgi:hypothetical protein
MRDAPRPDPRAAEEEKWWSVLTRFSLMGREFPVELYLSTNRPIGAEAIRARYHAPSGLWLATRVGADVACEDN